MNHTSGRLEYSNLSSSDFDLYASLVMNEEVMKYITGRALTEEEARQRFQKALLANDLLAGIGFFIARTLADHKMVGVSKLVQLADNQYEIGYMLLPEFWGRGYATEITETMIRLARQKNLTGELIGIVDPENPSSIKVLTKLGFQLIDTGTIDGLDAAYYKLKL
jgi:[ribosomal protein S5]-alanine N-acetyltransferase